MPRLPKMPAMPNSLYVYCTVIFSKSAILFYVHTAGHALVPSHEHDITGVRSLLGLASVPSYRAPGPSNGRPAFPPVSRPSANSTFPLSQTNFTPWELCAGSVYVALSPLVVE